MKQCTTCGEVKPLTEFYPQRKDSPLLCYQCKDCAKHAARAWHRTHDDGGAAARRAAREAARQLASSALTAEELAWAAGMFEGEGSIRINSATKRNSGALLVDMVNTDQQVVSFFQGRWPGYMRLVTSTGKQRDFYRWRCAAHQAARFLQDILPYLRTERVRTKALLGLEYQAQKSLLGVNRTPEYQTNQQDYFSRMAALNKRGRPPTNTTCPAAAAHSRPKGAA